jgi:hypothetical protein
VWESGCIGPHFLDLGTSWRSVDSSTPRPFYPRGKTPRYPLDRRLGGPGLDYEEKKKFLTLPGLWPLGRTACSQSLYRLRYPGLSIIWNLAILKLIYIVVYFTYEANNPFQLRHLCFNRTHWLCKRSSYYVRQWTAFSASCLLHTYSHALKLQGYINFIVYTNLSSLDSVSLICQ